MLKVIQLGQWPSFDLSPSLLSQSLKPQSTLQCLKMCVRTGHGREARWAAAVTVRVRVGMPEGAVAEALERMGQVTAALWRQNNKQEKKSKLKREKQRERRHGEDLALWLHESM